MITELFYAHILNTNRGYLQGVSGVYTSMSLNIDLYLKWYYDQKIISFFSSDFESVFAKHPTGKILRLVFYPTAV